jgi:hypothetical protein
MDITPEKPDILAWVSILSDSFANYCTPCLLVAIVLLEALTCFFSKGNPGHV